MAPTLSLLDVALSRFSDFVTLLDEIEEVPMDLLEILLTSVKKDSQAWCMLVNDKVLFRMQWPQYVDLQVNGMPVRAINRPGSQLLGVNGRDDGPIITPCTRDGINRISLSGGDSRIFFFGIRLVKRRTLKQVARD